MLVSTFGTNAHHHGTSQSSLLPVRWKEFTVLGVYKILSVFNFSFLLPLLLLFFLLPQSINEYHQSPRNIFATRSYFFGLLIQALPSSSSSFVFTIVRI